MIGPADSRFHRGARKRQVVVVIVDKRLYVPGFLLGSHQRIEQRAAQRSRSTKNRCHIHFTGCQLFEHDARRQVIRTGATRVFGQCQCAYAELRGAFEQIRHHRLFKGLQTVWMNGGSFHFALRKIA